MFFIVCWRSRHLLSRYMILYPFYASRETDWIDRQFRMYLVASMRSMQAPILSSAEFVRSCTTYNMHLLFLPIIAVLSGLFSPFWSSSPLASNSNWFNLYSSCFDIGIFMLRRVAFKRANSFRRVRLSGLKDWVENLLPWSACILHALSASHLGASHLEEISFSFPFLQMIKLLCIIWSALVYPVCLLCWKFSEITFVTYTLKRYSSLYVRLCNGICRPVLSPLPSR